MSNRILLLLCSLTIVSACTSTSTSGIKSDKTDATSEHTQLAAAYLDAGNLVTAQEEIEIALASDRNNSDANYVYALLMLQLRRTSEADEYFRRALRTNPDNAAAAHDYGVYLCRLGRASDSIQYFEIAAQNPMFDRRELSLMRAGECTVDENPEAAERFLRAALEINPRLQAALIQMASLSFDGGKYLQARAYIERYLGVSGETADGLFLAYQIESVLGADTVAGEYREVLLREFGGSDEARMLRSEGRLGQSVK
jgi:type IV pilus assembly protein PilF